MAASSNLPGSAPSPLRRSALLAVMILVAACSAEKATVPPVTPPAAVPTRVLITGAPAAPLPSLGDTVRLTAVVEDQSGRPMTGVTVEWSSSSAATLSVSSAGLLTAVANGTAVVTARSGGVSATTEVQVRQVPVQLRLAADTLRFAALTDTGRLASAVLDARGQAVAAGAPPLVWSTSDTAVLAIDSTGRITARANGIGTVTARSGALQAQGTVRVQQVVTRLVITPRVVVLASVGTTQPLTVAAEDARGRAVVGGTTSWAVTNAGVATVSGDGILTARAIGTSAVVANRGAVADTAFVRVGDPLRLVVRQEQVHQFVDSTRMPPYTYEGVTYPGGPVSFTVAGAGAFDLWEDGRPDVFVPLVKGYGSGIDSRMRPLFFRNTGGSLVHASSELTVPAIAGVRRVATFGLPGDPFRGLFSVNHDTHDGRMADGLLIAAGASPRLASSQLDPFPLSAAYGRPTAVNAHSMGAGDLNGDGRTDFVVGDWGDNILSQSSNPCRSCRPFFLLQQASGRWAVRQDDALFDITFRQPMTNAGGGQGSNLLIDLHLADLNGDGLADLVAGYGHGSTTSMVFFNQGDARFSRTAAAPLPTPPFGVDNSLHLKTYSLDLNGDRALDLVILHSRLVPYYGGYTFQILINDGRGRFRDETFGRLRSLPDREAPVARLSWSDNFQFLDVNGDGREDLIGSHVVEGSWTGVLRLWLNTGSGVFNEVPVATENFQNTPIPLGWADFGSGRIGTLAYRTSWTDARGSATRVWFTFYEFDRVIR